MSGVLARKDTAEHKPLVATFLTCILLGPPVGGLVMMLSLLGGDNAISNAGILQRIMTAIFSGLVIIPFSYVSGGLSALASGLAMVVYGWFKGLPPLWFAIGFALVAFAVLQSVQNDQASEAAWLLLAAHVVPAFVCWLVFRRFWVVRI